MLIKGLNRSYFKKNKKMPNYKVELGRNKIS